MTVPEHVGQFGLGRIGGHTGLWIAAGQLLNGDPAPYQHAWMYTAYLGDGQWQAVEAMPGGARVTTRWSPDDPRTAVSRFDLDPERRLGVAQEALAMVGVGYSFLDYGSLALLRLGIRPERVRRRVEGTGHMICSQYVDEAYKRRRVHLYADMRWPGDVIPGDLWRDFVRDRRQPARIDP